MSAMPNALPSSGWGRADQASFQANWPHPTSGPVPSSGPATGSVAGVAMPLNVGASDVGNPTIPWLGVLLVLVALRIASHLQKGGA